MKSTISKKYQTKGFTLLEVLAALLLTSLVVPAVMKGISLVTVLASESQRRYQAMELAENKLADVLLEETWSTGSAEGRFDEELYEGYTWDMTATDWENPDLRLVNVTVYWTQRNRPKQIDLWTLVYVSE